MINCFCDFCKTVTHLIELWPVIVGIIFLICDLWLWRNSSTRGTTRYNVFRDDIHNNEKHRRKIYLYLLSESYQCEMAKKNGICRPALQLGIAYFVYIYYSHTSSVNDCWLYIYRMGLFHKSQRTRHISQSAPFCNRKCTCVHISLTK